MNMVMTNMDIERKVTKIGNSLGVTMTEIFKKLGIDQGDTVKISLKGDEIIIKKDKKLEIPKGISPDFFDVVNDIIEEYDETLRGLKDR